MVTGTEPSSASLGLSGTAASRARHCASLGEKQTKMLVQLGDTPVEGFYRRVGSGEHHPTFHYRENISSESLGICTLGEYILDLFDALADCSNPALKVPRDQFVCRTVLGIDFQRQAAER